MLKLIVEEPSENIGHMAFKLNACHFDEMGSKKVTPV